MLRLEAQQKSISMHMQSLPDSHLPAAVLTFAICVMSTNLQAVPSGTSQQESLPVPMGSPGRINKNNKKHEEESSDSSLFKFDTQKYPKK